MWVVLLLALTQALQSVADQLGCWTLASAIACALAAIGHTTQASEQISYPDHASPVPAKPESMMVKATGRGLSIAGLLVSWIPSLSGGPQGLLLWFHMASATTAAAHTDLRRTLALVLLAVAHLAVSSMTLGWFDLSCAFLVPVMLRGTQLGAGEVNTLWTSRAQHRLLAIASCIASVLCAGSFTTFYSMESEAPWTTLIACLITMIIGIRLLVSHLLCVNSPSISMLDATWPVAGAVAAWVCAAAAVQDPHPRFLCVLVLSAMHIYAACAGVLGTQPPAAVASEASPCPPPSGSPRA